MGKNLLKGWETGDIVSQLISKDVIGTDVAETDIAETDVLDTNVTKENDLPEKFKNPDDIAVNSKKDIIVVIDPGHGVGSENVGAVATIGYKHYIQGLDGNFLLDAKGKKETK
jgi:N-acetylmuramoyl-L-alanine amidase